MDGRTALRLGVLLLGAAGCQQQVVTVPAPNPFSAAAKGADPSQVKPASAQATKDPPPMLLVAWGDFKAGEANAAEIAPARQQEIREDARHDYERALRIDPKYVPAHQGLARLHAAGKDYGRAAEAYTTALRLAPGNAALWYELGRCHQAQHSWAPAADCLGRAAQLDPGNRTYLNTLAVALAQAGRYDESLACFVRSAGEARGNLRLAQTLQHLQQPDLSRRYLAVALQKDPSLATSVEQAAYQPAH